MQVPFREDRNAPAVTAQLAAVPSETSQLTVPFVVPPLVASVSAVPYVPDVLVTLSAAWFAGSTVTVMVTVPPDT